MNARILTEFTNLRNPPQRNFDRFFAVAEMTCDVMDDTLRADGALTDVEVTQRIVSHEPDC